ncbi:MAG: RidA family protein [Ktedonobacterales bacterium]
MAPTASVYSQAVKAGGLVFVVGQGPFDSTTGAIVGATIQEQTALCLRIDSRVAPDPVHPSPSLEG